MNGDRRLASGLTIIDSTTHKQADAEKAMHPTALRLGYCGPGINKEVSDEQKPLGTEYGILK